MNEELITKEEFDRFKRFLAEQYKEYGVQLILLRDAVKNMNPSAGLAPQVKDLLARQVDKMSATIRYLESQVIQLNKKLDNK